jgi:3,4-dihydroxy 2-butanone 4-phosphate synthase / GTP cyclohydrolase II
MPSDNVLAAVEEIRQGKMVILVDDEDRENEGDLCMAAERVTSEAVNFMATEGRGLICLPMTEQRLRQLELPLMVHDNTSSFGTAFTVSIDAADGVGSGLSASDRARTIRTAVAPNASAKDLVRPGHVFPLRARDGGVLVRTGQTEGSVDLARLAGLEPAAVICEIMQEDGTMARRPQLERFAAEHALRIVTIAELVEFRLQNELLVEQTAVALVPTLDLGPFEMRVFRSLVDGSEHMALVRGRPLPERPTLVRVQSPCRPGDVFGVTLCDCGLELRASLLQIAEAEHGVFLYILRETGTLAEKVAGYARSGGQDGRPPDHHRRGQMGFREFGLGAQILRMLGLRQIRLLTNHARRFVGLEGYGLEIVESVPLDLDRVRKRTAAPEVQ